MPTIGSVELLIVILIAFLVVGPRDLPRLMRRVGNWVAQMRVMASEFQHNLDIVVKEADLDDLKKDALAIRDEANNIRRSVTSSLDPAKPPAKKPDDASKPTDAKKSDEANKSDNESPGK